MHADLFDEQAEEFLRLLGAFGGEDLVEVVSEAGESGDALLAAPLPLPRRPRERIAQRKRKGLARTRLRGLAGAQTWVASIALAHNLQRIALLT